MVEFSQIRTFSGKLGDVVMEHGDDMRGEAGVVIVHGTAGQQAAAGVEYAEDVSERCRVLLDADRMTDAEVTVILTGTSEESWVQYAAKLARDAMLCPDFPGGIHTAETYLQERKEEAKALAGIIWKNAKPDGESAEHHHGPAGSAERCARKDALAKARKACGGHTCYRLGVGDAMNAWMRPEGNGYLLLAGSKAEEIQENGGISKEAEKMREEYGISRAGGRTTEDIFFRTLELMSNFVRGKATRNGLRDWKLC